MAALFARAAAAAGFAVLLLDLTGTGDSAGEFDEAGLDLWLRDCASALDWLAERGHGPLHAVGLRTGANLAKSAAERNPSRIQGLVLWQPVLRGDVFLNQLLRVRLAGNLGPAAGPVKETTASLKQRLGDGETIEVAGYPISPRLAAELGRLKFADPDVRCPCPLSWIELAASPQGEPSPATAAALERLSASGSPHRYSRLEGEPFWSIEEPVLNPGLIALTIEQLHAF